MTRQRAQTSISRLTLFPSSRTTPVVSAIGPSTPPRIRTISGLSSGSTVEDGEKVITFKELSEGERGRLLEGLRMSLEVGIQGPLRMVD
jgi:hypothetical protein